MVQDFHTPKRARIAVMALALAAGTTALAASSDEASFLAENDAAMGKMMTGMQVEPSGDVDRDFVAMMVPHHQGAVDMAQAELRYGRNEQLRALAQGIVVTQQKEITVMRRVLGQPSTASPNESGTSPTKAQGPHQHSMGTEQP
jgi:uncharacterized protein (DUF305 family)